MAASFLPLGPILHFFRPRRDSDFYFLGTSVTAPTVEIEKVTTPVTTDLIGPVPTNYINHTEIHLVTTVLNNIDYFAYAALKNRGNADLRYFSPTYNVGQLTIPVEDFVLLLVHLPPHNQFLPSYVPQGRMYFSAEPVRIRETTERDSLLEVGVTFRCVPIHTVLPSGAKADSNAETKKKEPLNKSGSTSLTSSQRYELLKRFVDTGIANNSLDQFDPKNPSPPVTAVAPPPRPVTLPTDPSVVEPDVKKIKPPPERSGSPLVKGQRILSLYTEFPDDWF